MQQCALRNRSRYRLATAATLISALASAGLFACGQRNDDENVHLWAGTPMTMDLIVAGPVSAHLVAATADHCYVEAGRLDIAFTASIGGDQFRFRVESQQEGVPGPSTFAAVSVNRLSPPREGWLNLDPSAKDVAITLQSVVRPGPQGNLAATLPSFDGRAEPMTIRGTFQCSQNE